MHEDFGRWIVQQHWEEVLQAVGSDGKADALQEIIDAAMDTFFPLRTVRWKSTDPPWMSKKILKRMRRRMEIYIKEGRSSLWHSMKKTTDELIKASKAKYMVIKKKNLPRLMPIGVSFALSWLSTRLRNPKPSMYARCDPGPPTTQWRKSW